LNACNSVATNALLPLARVGLLGRTGSSSFGRNFANGNAGAARMGSRPFRSLLCPLPPWTWATASAPALASAPGPASAFARPLFPSRLHVAETLHHGALGVETAPLDVVDDACSDQADQVASLRGSRVGVARRGRHPSRILKKLMLIERVTVGE
jgi:hypothetical protein